MLCHWNCLCSTLNAWTRILGPCLNFIVLWSNLLSPLLSLFTFFFQSRTSPLRVLSATLDLPEQPGFGLCFAFLLGQICDCKLDFQSLTNMDIPANGFLYWSYPLKKTALIATKCCSVGSFNCRVHILLYFFQMGCDHSLLLHLRESIILVWK